MTKYEKMIEKSNESLEKALNTSNLDLRLFYLGASKGYKDKANNLTIEQGEQEWIF